MRIVWGLDIGGTKTAVLAGDESGKTLFRKELPTAGRNWRELIGELLDSVPVEYRSPLAIGVSCGGPLNSAAGLILSPPNLPGWDEVPICEFLRERLGIPAFLQNDANACALAEWKFGAGRGTKNMIFMTFGTGLGSGLILNGALYSGTCDMAGEVGHLRMAQDGPVGYYKAGSWEGFCSGGGLAQLAKLRLGRDMTAKELVMAADAGDEAAKSVLTESARILGLGLARLMDVLNPEMIVIGSIYARAERYFKGPALEAAREEALPMCFEACRVVPAALGDAIGDAAALTVAWNGISEA